MRIEAETAGSHGAHEPLMLQRFFRQPLDDVLACLEPLMTVRNPLFVMLPMMLAMVLCWILYVPIHELLHAYGCVWTGGDITELQISARYGGAIYAQYFDFIVTESDYAGRLSGFDTNESDLCYMATVFAPFMISVLVGIPLVKALRGRRRPLLFGVAIVLGFAPFYNLTGDYLEMGSIIVTRVATGGLGHPAVFAGIRSDDVFKLWSEVFTAPGELGLDSPGRIAIGVVLILLSMAMGIILSFATYWMGHLVAKALHVRGKAAGASSTRR
jgi:hypothetical protein